MSFIQKAEIVWHKGPSLGGVGTAGQDDDGQSRWYDGERLLIIINTGYGPEMAVVDITAEEDYFSVTDASGNSYDSWSPEDWAWWAKMDKNALPKEDAQ